MGLAVLALKFEANRLLRVWTLATLSQLETHAFDGRAD